jgi:hypothetical protein
MKFVVPYIIVCSASMASADISDRDTLYLLGAKTVEDVSTASDQAEKIRLSRASCEAQQRAKQIPVNCFETLQLELRYGIVDSNRADVIATGLSASCDERIFKQTSVEILDAALKKSYLPKRCRTLVEKRLRELLYIMSSRGDLNLMSAGLSRSDI